MEEVRVKVSIRCRMCRSGSFFGAGGTKAESTRGSSSACATIRMTLILKRCRSKGRHA